MSSLVQCFEKLIHPEWKLPRSSESSAWVLTEAQNQNSLGKNCQIEIFGGPSFAFSLDQLKADPWPFLNEAGMKGMRKVCDALIVVHKKDEGYKQAERNYVIALEMKSTSEGEAVKQIASSRLLMDWLIGLLKLHRHWNGDCKFCGVISFTPRNQERKGVADRKGNTAKKMSPLPQPKLSQSGYPVFCLNNHPRLDIVELISAIDGAL